MELKTEISNMKSCLSSSYTIPSVTVCAQSGRHLHRNLHVSCADRTFSAAAGLPVCRPCTAAEVGPVLKKTGPCQEISPTTFWHCNPYSALKFDQYSVVFSKNHCFLANVNSSSCSLYVVVRPSVVCLSSVCRLSSVVYL